MNDAHLKDLRPDPLNARAHNPRNVGMLVDALHEVGTGRSIVLDENNVVLAGNATIEAAAEAGIENVIIVDVDGKSLVAVRRTGLTPEQKQRLALYDNRVAELASWDAEALASLNDAGLLDDLFYDDELDRLLAGLERSNGAGDDPGAQPDRAKELAAEWKTAPGQVWTIPSATVAGRDHRLVIGDATSADDVARLMDGLEPRLMVSDPPYGVKYNPAWRDEAFNDGQDSGRATGKVNNDETARWARAWELSPAKVAYVWHGGLHGSEVEADLRAAGFVPRAQIIWRKLQFVISRGDYNWQHEPCWYAVRKGATAEWLGTHSETTVWEFGLDERADGGHSTQKPVEAMLRPIRNHAGDVYDPFVGTGTTIVAAEQAERICYAMEIDPGDAAVTLERLKGMGLGPKLLTTGY